MNDKTLNFLESSVSDFVDLCRYYMKFVRVIGYYYVQGKHQICVRYKEVGNLYDIFPIPNAMFKSVV